MPVYVPTAIVGNDQTLLTLGHSGEIMGWFYPAKDHAQNIHQCLPCVYTSVPHSGYLSWCWDDKWERHQQYAEDSNICVTTLTSHQLGLQLILTDVVPAEGASLVRQIAVRNLSDAHHQCGIFHYGDWNLGGIRVGNALRFDRAEHALVQSHRDVAVAIGGDALQVWQCGKAGLEWGSNALHDLNDGALNHQDLEIGDVNWAFGFYLDLHPGETVQRTAIFALAPGSVEALANYRALKAQSFEEHVGGRQSADAAWLAPGLEALRQASGDKDTLPPNLLAAYKRSGLEAVRQAPDVAQTDEKIADILPPELLAAYKRSLLALPLLCGKEGVALAAPEFDPEFISCGGYGYLWPRDGGEYISGLLDAGYPQFAGLFFDWSARHQDASGLWHQRYFLNGEPGPNWCLPPDMLQIDQVGAVLWAYGKWLDMNPSQKPFKLITSTAAMLKQLDELFGSQIAAWKGDDPSLPKQVAEGPGEDAPNQVPAAHQEMIRKAADYLISRLTERGVHGNAFDTWETFVGSFTYSNAAIYAAFVTAARVLQDEKYEAAAKRVKAGVLEHFVRDDYLTRGLYSNGEPDITVDSASLGAIEPFGLLDLQDEHDLRLAEGLLAVITHRLETDWEGGRAIRRFEGDAYVGGVPACVNTLWMARCCLKVADRLQELGRTAEAATLTQRAQVYLTTVLRRATPTGLLPELMQGPTGQRYWAAPHGWAMASFVSGVLMLARRLNETT